MNKLLLDTNVILDFALIRDPYHEYAKILLKSNDEKYLTATTVTDLYYLISKFRDRHTARQFLHDIIDAIGILGVEERTIKKALDSDFTDFEDGVQSVTASDNEIDFIITRNKKDFSYSIIPALTPEEYLKIDNP